MVAISKSAELPAEIKWYHDSLSINYNIILDVRNEMPLLLWLCISGVFIDITIKCIPNCFVRVQPIIPSPIMSE